MPSKFADELPSEAGMVASLKESNIKVFAIEFRTSILRPDVNLLHLVTQLDGSHALISDPTSITNQLLKILNQVVSHLKRTIGKAPNRYVRKTLMTLMHKTLHDIM
jgi:hypothetical protein